MKRFICILPLLCLFFIAQEMHAQPAARRAEKEKAKDQGPTLSVRAQTQYNGQVAVPEEVIWKREIYRELDLKKEKNSPLYYPAEPVGQRMNLFTLIFKLLTEDKIKAYEYRLDGMEDLSDNSRISIRDVMDRFHIYYDETVQGRDTLYVVDNSDIPSAEVLSYFIKEEWYFDQRTSTYNTRVIAICPVMHRAGDFVMEVAKYPMFWLNYHDISPYLGRMPIMTSNLNNTANVTMDDYFTARQFQGDIYKTTNMLNQALDQYCETDSAKVKEQQRIEGQLEAFGKNLWESTRIVPEENFDSTAIAATATPAKKVKANEPNSKRKGRDKATAQSSSSGSSKTKEPKVKSSSKSSGSSSSSARVSVRRQRR